MSSPRRILREAVLRGPLLDRWTLRRSRQLEESYLDYVSRERAATAVPPEDPPLPRPQAPGQPLRTILFIGDCMWEQNELFPEFKKFATLQHLDLRPLLRAAPEQPEAETVAGALEQFTGATHGWEPDVILFYARPALLSDAAFDLIRRRWKCPLLGMNLDDRAQFFPYGVFASRDDDYARWSTKFDLNLTNAYTSLDWYRRRGAAVRYFPQGFHLEKANEAPPQSAEFEHRFSFLGSWKIERGVILDELRRRDVAITLFGKGWPNSQWVDSASRVFRSSQINLGIGFALASARVTTTKGRDFECPGVGACYLTTYNWELPMLYDVGREILLYRDVEELIEMHAHYIKRPEACLRIAQAAHRRCLAEHTWEKRFRKLFGEMGFDL